MKCFPYSKIVLLLSMGAIMLLLGGWTISKTADTKELNSDSIDHYYSYDPDTYSYNYITELKDQNNLIKQLNQVISLSKEDRLAKETVVGGFLLVGKNGDKTEYYLSNKGLYNEDNKVFSIPEEPQKELLELSKKCNLKYPATVQWLAFMSNKNIDSVVGECSLFMPNQQADHWNIDTKDQKVIEKIGNVLKKIQVNPKGTVARTVEVNSNADPVSSLSLRVSFGRKINYFITMGESWLSISSSDRKTILTYSLAEGEFLKLVNELETFKLM